jgi:hypothetical protein
LVSSWLFWLLVFRLLILIRIRIWIHYLIHRYYLHRCLEYDQTLYVDRSTLYENRPDITIRNPDGLNLETTEILIDVSMICTVEGSGSCVLKSADRNKVNQIGYRADKRYEDKMKHYKNIMLYVPMPVLGMFPGQISIHKRLLM